MKILLFLILTAALSAGAALLEAPVPFSALPPDTPLPASWRPLTVPNVKANEAALVSESGRTVLRLKADAAAGTIASSFKMDTAKLPILNWRWKIDRVVSKADLNTKGGDDFAARVYVFFDVPLESLSFGARTRIKMAKFLYGADLPTAALCYVWDNKHAPGTSAWSAYTDRVRVIVARSGSAQAGQWAEESVDIARDFEAAFGFKAPALTGIALGNDTDQTGESVTAWFGDVRFRAAP